MFSSSLFGKQHIDEVFRAIKDSIRKEVASMSPEQVQAADSDSVAARFVEKHRKTCPALGDDISAEEPPFVQGAREVVVKVIVPFNGDSELFHCHGREHPVITESIKVLPGCLEIGMRADPVRMDLLQVDVEKLIKRINEGLENLRRELDPQYDSVKAFAISVINEKKAELAKHQEMLGKLKGTKFTIKRRDDGKEKVLVPIQQKKIEIEVPKAASEPELSLGAYEDILSVIRSMVTVFERSPTVFQKMEEEHLRTILLVALNGLFEGAATGETFNGKGKTDILIRVEDKNVFIAECLIWSGSEHFRKKLVDQLLNYATWRDGKLAAIIFNRNKNFTEVIENMKAVTKALPGFLSVVECPGESGIRTRMRREDDPRKEFILTCMAFEVPK